MIQEQYVEFETAKLLKENGFNEWCAYCYGIAVMHNGREIDEDEEYELKSCGKGNEIEYIDGGHLYRMNYKNDMNDAMIYACPTQQMAMRWLREVYGLYIEVSLSCERKDKNAKIFDASIFNIQNQRYKKLGNIQDYEEACEVAIKYCLENLI